MKPTPPQYPDGLIAIIAGSIAAGMANAVNLSIPTNCRTIAERSVNLARQIVTVIAETRSSDE